MISVICFFWNLAWFFNERVLYTYSDNPSRIRREESWEMAANGNGEFSFGKGTARKGLAKIQTAASQKKQSAICHDDSTPPVKAQTIDELHSLQKKRSAPNTPIKGTQGSLSPISDEARQKLQLQSIRFNLHTQYTL